MNFSRSFKNVYISVKLIVENDDYAFQSTGWPIHFETFFIKTQKQQ